MNKDALYKDKYESLKKQFEVFAYGVSHDLSAPLRHVREFTEILLSSLDGGVKEEQRETIYFIEEGIKRSELMIEGLLAYSRLSEAKVSYVPFSLEDLFEDVTIGCRELIVARSAKVSLPEKLPEIVGDRVILRSVLACLFENAIKFCASEVVPDVCCDVKDMGDNYEFSIRDNGVGIDEKYFQDIFKIFKQLDPESEGIGVGLTLAQKNVEICNGRIWLESDLGKGSIFYVSVPKKIREVE